MRWNASGPPWGPRRDHRRKRLEDSACLFVVYPYDAGESSGDALVPGFWKPFWNLPLTVALGLLIPGLASFLLGYFVFRSRVRGVYFAILTQAIAVASWLVFCRNGVKLCGTNGLVRFGVIRSAESLTTFNPVDAKDKWVCLQWRQHGLGSQQGR